MFCVWKVLLSSLFSACFKVYNSLPEEMIGFLVFIEYKVGNHLLFFIGHLQFLKSFEQELLFAHLRIAFQLLRNILVVDELNCNYFLAFNYFLNLLCSFCKSEC